MTDLIRSQNLARVQGQQQLGQQQQQQQQFGLSSSQMSAPGQHSGFHDQQSGQQGQPQIPSGFGSNIGLPNSSQLQANFNNRNAMLHTFNQAPMARQLELIGMTQNQQHPNPQTSSASFAARMAQQQQGGMNGQPGQNQGQPTLFSSPIMPASDARRASPSHPSSQAPGSIPNQQGGMQPNGQGVPGSRRALSLLELKDRASQIQSFISKQEATAMNLNSNRSSVEPTVFMAQMQALAADVRNKKELLAKILHTMNQMAPQGLNNSNGTQGGNSGNM
jgi:hypothetical protein